MSCDADGVWFGLDVTTSFGYQVRRGSRRIRRWMDEDDCYNASIGTAIYRKRQTLSGSVLDTIGKTRSPHLESAETVPTGVQDSDH